MRRPDSRKTLAALLDKIESAFETFEDGARDLARGGDERSDPAGFDHKALQTEIKSNPDLTASDRARALSELGRKNREAEHIGCLISRHQTDMQQHLSGSEYHRHLAELESAIGM